MEDTGYIACKGKKNDGHRFIDSLPGKVPLIIYEEGKYSKPGSAGHTEFIPVSDSRAFSKKIAPVFYDFPSMKLRMHGVTGTNGKTTTVYMLDEFLRFMGKRPGVIGTIEYRFADQAYTSKNTTPDVLLLQDILYRMHTCGTEEAVMEVSSHALVENRIAEISYDTISFTNITPEHLDFHGTMDNYLKAKMLAFELLEKSRKPLKKAAVWKHTDRFMEIKSTLASYRYPSIFYAVQDKNEAGLGLTILESYNGAYLIDVYYNSALLYHGTVGITGRYNLLNMLNALSIALPFESDVSDAELGKLCTELLMHALPNVSVPGRMERIHNPIQALVLVDYAHSPDGLLNALRELSQIPHNRLIIVFGCGGDRDKTKRPVMGQIAAEYADEIFITSDNPRTENPVDILAQISSGIKNTVKTCTVLENREEAIKAACSILKENDILLIAGKGHEDYQEISGVRRHFDDREIARKYLTRVSNM